MRVAAKEKRFLDALEALFTGAEVEGDSGFVNLMRMKRQYFQSWQGPLLEKIDGRVGERDDFREELFDKLYTFFSRYFCESGSIYFRHLPAFAKIYERVYADGEDVALSWKTHMLYYVKSDVLVRSMPVELKEEGPPAWRTWRFDFDASQIEHKRNNEKREFVFAFSEVEKATGELPVLRLKVSYSEKGKKTKVDDILKQARKAGMGLSEERLEQAFRVFRRQTEADYFINKDARGFLREQFDLWMHQYLFQEETIFEQKRLNQLQVLQETAYDIINFIAQFEDELRRAWEKPKFVRNVNYVVTLDKLPDKTLKKITEHKGAKAQIKEWRELDMVDDEFSMTDLFKGQKDLTDKNGANGARKFLPLDTKHFKTLEVEILEALGNLDEALDGELAHSENWQALNTLSKRYQEKVKCIYIDPPFNLEGSDQFDYRTNYKDSCWATLLENRLTLARTLLSETGSIFVRCDYNGNWIVRRLLDNCFGEGNFVNEIALGKSNRIKTKGTRFLSWHDTLFFYGKSEKRYFEHIQKERRKKEADTDEWRAIDNDGESWVKIPLEIVPFLSPENVKYDDESHPRSRARIICGKEKMPPPGRRYPLQEAIWEMEEQGIIRLNENGNPQMKKQEFVPLTDNWTDLFGYSSSWKFSTENSESVLDRVICSSAADNAVVMDFFLGSGTTTAVSQKLSRKWLGVEMGAHFHTVVLPRMKKTLSGHQSGISKETDYKGGGAFKYYTLEQYEETLKNARYKDGDQLEIDSLKSPFEQYVFFGDDKLAHAVQSVKNGKLKINLKGLYKDIDIAESLSNILGKPIRRRTANEVTFTDGTVEKINPAKMTEEEKQHFITLIKPYLWWGER